MDNRVASAVFFTVIGGITAGLLIFTIFILTPKGQQDLQNAQKSGRTDTLDAEQVTDNVPETDLEETADGTLAPKTPPMVLKKYTIENATERQAVCNDGTPATFYFASATAEASDKWVIYLKGGGACSDEETCLDREANDDQGLMTSKNYPNGLKESGVLSANPEINPDFYNWNRVHVRYCSSDSWIGDAEAMIGDELWQFRGKNIVAAVMEDLQNEEILQTKTLAEASELLFVGSSAGGAGLTHNLDDVAAMLPNVQIKGVADSSGSIAYDFYDPTMLERFEAVSSSFQNRQMDESCVAANSESPQNCLRIDTYYDHISTPIYHYIDQYDSNRIGNYLTFPLDADEKAWARGYAETLVAYVETIDGYYVPNKTWHTALTNERFNAESIDGVSFQEALHNWYFNEGTYNYIAD